MQARKRLEKKKQNLQNMNSQDQESGSKTHAK